MMLAIKPNAIQNKTVKIIVEKEYEERVPVGAFDTRSRRSFSIPLFNIHDKIMPKPHPERMIKNTSTNAVGELKGSSS
jgi:hypothetical protein